MISPKKSAPYGGSVLVQNVENPPRVKGWPGGRLLSPITPELDSSRLPNSDAVGRRHPARPPVATFRQLVKDPIRLVLRVGSGTRSHTRPLSRSSTAWLPKLASTTNRGQFAAVA